ncbi:MAG: 4-hydroxy-tetrahydrodipicolinate reductase [Bdellovibrionales bacterium]|nr:4-hydroxy-tetrahydrodipicolinate reductase [Bdellovibrionales bacterium]
MKIAIVGYGKMGHEVETCAKEAGIAVSQVFDLSDDLKQASFSKDEVVIEFTTPESCVKNLENLLSKRVAVVCGTTGWYDQIPYIRDLTHKHSGSVLYASNFSIGVHLFWQTLHYLSTKIEKYPSYDIHMKEVHHIQKKDKPSGTARTSMEIIRNANPHIKNIPIECYREGDAFGDHHVFFESSVDSLELTHKAKSRQGFAMGAIECAKWLTHKKGFFSIDDYIKEKLS